MTHQKTGLPKRLTAIFFALIISLSPVALSSVPGEEGPTRFAAYGVEIPPLASTESMMRALDPSIGWSSTM